MDMDYEKLGYGLLGIVIFYFAATRLPPLLMGKAAKMMGASRGTAAADEPESRPAPRQARSAAAPASAVGFTREAVDAVDGDWDEIARVNAQLASLQARQRPVVAREGELLRSKVAWKIVAFEQAALQRVLALADGAVRLWNLRSVAGAVLCARSVMETSAALLDVAHEVGRLAAAGDVAAIDALLTRRAFGAEMGGLTVAPRAADLVRLIDTADRQAPGTRARYDILAGLTGPDAVGLVRMEGEIDKSGTTVTFSSTAMFERGLLNQVAGGLQALAVADAALAELTAALTRVVELDQS
jgi:hypothetical protein